MGGFVKILMADLYKFPFCGKVEGVEPVIDSHGLAAAL